MTQFIATPPADPLEPITVTIAPRLVAELPRFFGGFKPMLRELFQNAFRAGTQRVTITSSASFLVFADDGRGITDLAILFCAGATGWNETDVKNPAGLGVFSLLNPSIVSNLSIRSRNWEVSTTPPATRWRSSRSRPNPQQKSLARESRWCSKTRSISRLNSETRSRMPAVCTHLRSRGTMSCCPRRTTRTISPAP